VRVAAGRAEIAGTPSRRAAEQRQKWLLDADGQPSAWDLYAKVVNGASEPGAFRVRFTSVPPEASTQLEALLRQVVSPPGAIAP
jgi:hypothetical protein